MSPPEAAITALFWAMVCTGALSVFLDWVWP